MAIGRKELRKNIVKLEMLNDDELDLVVGGVNIGMYPPRNIARNDAGNIFDSKIPLPLNDAVNQKFLTKTGE